MMKGFVSFRQVVVGLAGMATLSVGAGLVVGGVPGQQPSQVPAPRLAQAVAPEVSPPNASSQLSAAPSAPASSQPGLQVQGVAPGGVTVTGVAPLRPEDPRQLIVTRDNVASVVAVPPGVSTAAYSRTVAQQAGVTGVAPNTRYYPFEATPTSDDPLLPTLWGLGPSSSYGIDYSVATVREPGAKRVIVAVLDSGVDISHPDLAGNIFTNQAEANGQPGVDDDNNGYIDDVHGWDFLHNDNTVYDAADGDKHGTHVAGTIAATANNGQGVAGVAPGVTILPLKFIGPGGGDTMAAVRAISYAKAMGATVINASWGAPGRNYYLQDAITRSGMVFVAAAGNSGLNIDSSPVSPASLLSPNMVTVGAMASDGSVPYWSNYGRRSVDVMAPGVSILSTVPGGGYEQLQGTSMAAPHVAGVAALLASRWPGWDVVKAAAGLRASVIKYPQFASRCATGGEISAALVLNVRPVGSLAASWYLDKLRLSWKNPVDAAFVRTEVRLASGAAVPGPTEGTLVYSAGPQLIPTATVSTILPALDEKLDYTVAVYAIDSTGPRAAQVVRITGTTLTSADAGWGLWARLTSTTTGAPLYRQPVDLLKLQPDGTYRRLYRRSTDINGFVVTPRLTGTFRWQFLSIVSAGRYYNHVTVGQTVS